jgi:hypothetical protein
MYLLQQLDVTTALREDVFDAFDFLLVQVGRANDLAVGASANADFGDDTGGTNGMNSCMTVVYCLRDLGPWTFCGMR